MSSMGDPETLLSRLLSEALTSKVQQHRQQEQQHVDALLASQKYLTSNLRTTINSLDTILQLSVPRYSNNQGDLLSSCVARARQLGAKLDLVAARLARIQEHLEQERSMQEDAAQQAVAAAATEASAAATTEAAAAPAAAAEAAGQEGTVTLPPAAAPAAAAEAAPAAPAAPAAATTAAADK